MFNGNCHVFSLIFYIDFSNILVNCSKTNYNICFITYKKNQNLYKQRDYLFIYNLSLRHKKNLYYERSKHRQSKIVQNI